MDSDFGELKNDVNFVTKVESVKEAIGKIEEAIKSATEIKIDELSTEEKVKHDIFLAYAVNSLFWMYLKMNGEDVNTHGIKHELSRIRDSMQRQKQIHDHKTIRPVLKQDAAKRMVRGGLYDFKQKNEEFQKRRQTSRHQHNTKIYINGNPNPQNRKRRFSDD